MNDYSEEDQCTQLDNSRLIRFFFFFFYNTQYLTTNSALEAEIGRTIWISVKRLNLNEAFHANVGNEIETASHRGTVFPPATKVLHSNKSMFKHRHIAPKRTHIHT